uniref:Chromobox protein homolog 6 n=1 Tax=Haemonchus contortus TaxID=6289 RepID=A0A7I4Z4W4_HAECO
MKERVIPWELADEELMRRMEKRTFKRKSEPTKEPLPRRSKRKRKETARMTEFRESGKRSKISWIGLSETEDVNKISRYGVRPIKEAGRGRQLSYVLVAWAAPAAAGVAHRGEGGRGGPVGPAAEPPTDFAPGRDWSSGGGAVATGASNGAGGMGPAREAGKTASEGPPQDGGRRTCEEPFGIWGSPQPTAKIKKPQ